MTTTANPVRDAADRLADLGYHLDRFEDAAPLARHLRATHDTHITAGEEEDLTALRALHAAGHAVDTAEAASALHDAEEGEVRAQRSPEELAFQAAQIAAGFGDPYDEETPAGPCRYAAAHQMAGVPATTTINCGPVGIVPACQACAAFYARNTS